LEVYCEVIEKWISDKAAKLGASLSFTHFFLAPLLIIAIALAGLILVKMLPGVKLSVK
jgi:uncharacterized BrkB/YihY/UPF0761 family membrane protein